ncbi:MAG: mandelate racemase/muconate lactonizing enzyme family protein [Armatimonadetes bacterium]|nr:mandelate racemase/muconate lactonizing enzyme family protein [Armatimonadota bacterium]
MKITSIELLSVRVPVPQEEVERGKIAGFSGVRLQTDEGITGYGFGGVNPQMFEDRVKPKLVGKDPFAVERHLRDEVLGPALLHCAPVEHALWDIVGKAAGLPIYRLLGADKDRVKAYLTCVWRGKDDQSHIEPEDQATQARKYRDLGWQGIKVRSWRPDPMEDVRAAALIKQATDGKMEVMIDRTAHHPGAVWDWDTAYKVARGLEQAGATWLEEPFDRNDFSGLARLAEAVDIPITGGEGERGLLRFAEFLRRGCFDIVQPDAVGSGGLLTIKKVSALAESFGLPCIPHGSNGFGLLAPLQIIGALPNCEWLEVALVHPPLTPQEMWSPLEQLLKEPPLFQVEEGHLLVPDKPGLGVELNEEAVEEFRV